MYRVTVNSTRAVARVRRIQQSIASRDFEQVFERAARMSHSRLTAVTPTGWTKLLRKRWAVDKTRLMVGGGGAGGVSMRWTVRNRMPRILGYLEMGTRAHGPKYKKFLFIPLNAVAALGGWHPGLVLGRDYILKRRVRGIKARWYVRRERPRALRTVRSEMRAYLRHLLTV